jgi:hypothetical protein
MPTVEELKKDLWHLCFPGDPFESNAALQDLYEHALIRHRNDLAKLMISPDR